MRDPAFCTDRDACFLGSGSPFQSGVKTLSHLGRYESPPSREHAADGTGTRAAPDASTGRLCTADTQRTLGSLVLAELFVRRPGQYEGLLDGREIV